MAEHDPKNDRTPQMVVFDLDYVLWPTPVGVIPAGAYPPFKKTEENKIIDAHHTVIEPYPASTGLLKTLSEKGYKVAIASSSRCVDEVNHLLHLLDWDKYINYKEIYPGAKTNHFARIKSTSGIDYEDMMFFGYKYTPNDDIYDVSRLGVLSIGIQSLTCDYVHHGFKLYAENKVTSIYLK